MFLLNTDQNFEKSPYTIFCVFLHHEHTLIPVIKMHKKSRKTKLLGGTLGKLLLVVTC